MWACEGIGAWVAGRLWFENPSLLGKYSRGPPSIDSDTCIFVSLVVRLIRAVRVVHIVGPVKKEGT